jgi:hypothetical protein
MKTLIGAIGLLFGWHRHQIAGASLDDMAIRLMLFHDGRL